MQMLSQFLDRAGNRLSVLNKKFQRRIRQTKVISLKPEQPTQGNVLISYIIEPFLLKPEQPISNIHTSHWESWQIAKIFLELGYSVDFIAFNNQTFVPKKDYELFIDIRFNFARLVPLLNQDCIKILHSDTAHILFQNAAECNRLLALQIRKGISLRPRRFETPTQAVEQADYITLLGNEFTISTFKYANKPIYRVPISTPGIYSWSEEKDFEACRNHWLWLGSRGMVHKGLDLVLDAFAEMPDYHLTVCGPVQGEQDFRDAFYQELYQTSNIKTIGWVNTNSPEFIQIINSCVGLIYPSCSEGGGGSAIQCMHAGLIPVVSYETSVDVDDSFGVILNQSSTEEIKHVIQRLSSLPAQKLKQMARNAWEFARANHTRESFTAGYRQVIHQIITDYRNRDQQLE
jgi:glycosyltransferase involved in cell wall biosynthesis